MNEVISAGYYYSTDIHLLQSVWKLLLRYGQYWEVAVYEEDCS